MILRPVIIVVLVLGILSPASQSLRFELQSGHTKCISEDIKSNSMTVGKYHVVNPNQDHPLPDSHKLTVKVTAPHGNSYHTADKVETGQFAFTAAEEGGYMACFWAEDRSPETTMTVDFDWRTGVHAKDWSNVAKKGQVEGMEVELKKLHDVVTSIHEEMFYLRAREEEMQELNRTTTTKMFCSEDRHILQWQRSIIIPYRLYRVCLSPLFCYHLPIQFSPNPGRPNRASDITMASSHSKDEQVLPAQVRLPASAGEYIYKRNYIRIRTCIGMGKWSIFVVIV